MWVKTTAFFGRGEAVTVDGVFVVLSVCCLVLLSASLFTVQFLNRWRPVSWWSWGEAEGGSCWAEEVDRAANRQRQETLTSQNCSSQDNVAHRIKSCHHLQNDWQVF